MLTLGFGIFFGLATAWGNTIAYVASRWFTVGGRGGTLRLIALAHTTLGVAGVLVTLMFWPAGGFSWAVHADWLTKALGATVTFGFAQGFLLVALRSTEASRVAPLLGVKIAVLAGMTWVLAWWGSQPTLMTPQCWLAVGVAVSAGFVLHGAGGRLGWKPTLCVLGAVLSYASCDLLILATIVSVEKVLLVADTPWWWPGEGWQLAAREGDGALVISKLWASYLTAGAVYALSGLVAAGMLPWYGTRDWRTWWSAGGYAGGWALAMAALYPCFALIGVVLGAILQSSRALWSILVGLWLSRSGHHHLEPAHGAGVWVRRGLAAGLMVLAVVLYATGMP